MRATPEALAAADASLVRDSATCEFKLFRIPAASIAKSGKFGFNRNYTYPPTGHELVAGNADWFDNIVPASNGVALRDWESISKWLESVEGLELVSAPRLTTKLVPTPWPSRPSLPGQQPSDRNFSLTWPITGSPIVSPYFESGTMKASFVFETLVDQAAGKSSDATQTNNEVIGIVFPIRLERIDDESVMVDFALANRFKRYNRHNVFLDKTERSGKTVKARRWEMGTPTYYEEGFRYRLPVKLGGWDGFTYLSEVTRDRYLVFLRVLRATVDDVFPPPTVQKYGADLRGFFFKSK
jgi:hypothetical protein